MPQEDIPKLPDASEEAPPNCVRLSNMFENTEVLLYNWNCQLLS